MVVFFIILQHRQLSVAVISCLVVYTMIWAPGNLPPLSSHALHRRTTNHRPGSPDLLSPHFLSYRKPVSNNCNKILKRMAKSVKPYLKKIGFYSEKAPKEAWTSYPQRHPKIASFYCICVKMSWDEDTDKGCLYI